MTEHKIVLPAKLIPCGSKVSRVRGAMLYILNRELPLWGVDGKKVPIVGYPDDMFMSRVDTAAISMIDEDIELIWYISTESLARHLGLG